MLRDFWVGKCQHRGDGFGAANTRVVFLVYTCKVIIGTYKDKNPSFENAIHLILENKLYVSFPSWNILSKISINKAS